MSALGGGREFDLIRGFLAGARSRPELQVGAGDDCAVLTVAPFAISTDLSVEHVHFRRDWLAAEEIGYRAAVAALSDLAAVAAEPVAALVSFAFADADADAWAPAVMQGVNEALAEYDVALAGGDVTRADSAVIDVVVIGKADPFLLRSGARTGDSIWVTGTLGGAAAAVAHWLEGAEPAPALRERFARPRARIAEAAVIRAQATACIDLSDGVAGDAGHIAAASGCRLVIDARLLPVHAGATLAQALSGGEDYELCFTMPPGITPDIGATRIGVVVTGSGVEIVNGPAGAGFDHFSTLAQ